LQGAGVDALSGECGAMLAGPMDVGGFAQGEEEIEFFFEELVVVLEFETEEGEGFDERAAAGDDFGAAAGDEVESGEVLKDADGVGGAEDGDGRGEADVFCSGGGCGENDGGGGVEILDAVVLAEAEGVEANLVGEFDLLEELDDAFVRGDGVTRDGIWNQCCEAVDADLHPVSAPLATSTAA